MQALQQNEFEICSYVIVDMSSHFTHYPQILKTHTETRHGIRKAAE